MTTPRLDVDPFVLKVMSESHDVPIHRGRGRRWITITNPVTQAVVRVVATRTRPMGCPGHHPDQRHWHYANSDWNPLGVDSIRPLVVIDPEDRIQVARLVDAIEREEKAGTGGTLTRHQQALRSLIAPPKPEEPTDPKTRVTDRRENIWRLLADGSWVCTSGPDVGEYLAWSRLAGERGPLSIEGVTQ